MRLFHFLLRCLDPELAHHLGVWGLRLLQWVRVRLLGERVNPAASTSGPWLCGKTVRNRLGLAAGFDKNAEVFASLGLLGFGFVEVGTVTPVPQEGNPKPRLFRVGGGGLVNAMGFNNCGLVEFKQNIRRYRNEVPGVVLLANVGKNKDTPAERAIDDYHAGVTALAGDVDGFVFNLSSPNTPGLRDLQTEDFLDRLNAILPQGVVGLVKLAPDLSDGQLEVLCRKIGGLNRLAGVILTNTSRAIADRKGYRQGGYSGPLLFERSLECVKLARGYLTDGKVVVGVGGVHDKLCAERMLAAGADFVEVYTAFVYRGPKLVKDLRNIGRQALH